MLYNLVNGAAVIAGGLFGLLIGRFLPKKTGETLLKAMALGVMYVGITTMISEANALTALICLALGVIIGELLKIEDRINKLGEFVENKFKKNAEETQMNLAQGFVSATILFCSGSMAIVGSLQAGLTGDGSTLLAKSILDGVVAMIYSTTMGFGVLISAIPVIIYQGIFVLAASGLSDLLNEMTIATISTVGGIIILGIGINMMFETKIRIGNFIPAVFIPILLSLLNII